MRRSNQPHHHVKMFGKYKVKLKVDPWDEFDYHLGIVDQPPDTTQAISASRGLLNQSPRTITRSYKKHPAWQKSYLKPFRSNCLKTFFSRTSTMMMMMIGYLILPLTPY